MVTTNYTEQELMDKIGGAALSRLLGMCRWHDITARDFRLLPGSPSPLGRGTG